MTEEWLSKVCGAMTAQGYCKQAYALSGTCKEGGREEVARIKGKSLLQKKHPMDALTYARSNLERWCLMRCILQNEAECLPPSGNMLLASVSGMRDFVSIYSDKMATTLKQMGERTAYTYQFVQRVKATMAGKRVVDGEMLRRVFICFPNAGLALSFVELWQHAQHAEIKRQELDKATCLLECGTYDDGHLRKWVLDVDASIAELKKDPYLWPPDMADERQIKSNLHTETMTMACNTAKCLWEMGHLHQPCHFAVTTRHSPKKMSWHITLCALAPHERWRSVLMEMEQKFEVVTKLGRMYGYVDKGTKNNSKSQYMQARGSTKVAAGVKADGNLFKDAGLFRGDGEPVAIPVERHSILFYAVTSVVVHDPWSIPFARQSTNDDETILVGKKRKKTSVKKEQKVVRKPSVIDIAKEEGLQISAITDWDQIPATEAAWMRKLVERSDGTTRLSSIPSMAEPQHWCSEVVGILNAGRGNVKLYCKVEYPVLCPKYLKAKKIGYQHGSTNGMMLMIVEESHPECRLTSFRMFTRCFSEKCKDMRCTHTSGAWVELGMSDYLMLKATELQLFQSKRPKPT